MSQVINHSNKKIKQIKNRNVISKLMVSSKHSSKREVHSNKCLPQEIRKVSNKQPNFTPQEPRKRRSPK